jgi:hypothetical protein
VIRSAQLAECGRCSIAAGEPVVPGAPEADGIATGARFNLTAFEHNLNGPVMQGDQLLP